MKKCLSNKIYVSDTISEAGYVAFSRRLAFLEKHLPSLQPIEIEVCSGGGDPMAALAYFHKIVNYKKHKIVTFATGQVASAATLILLAGHERKMASNAWVMVHEECGKISGSHSDKKRSLEWGQQLEDQWNALFASRTNATAEYWESINRETTYLDPEECKTLGLIHEVI